MKLQLRFKIYSSLKPSIMQSKIKSLLRNIFTGSACMFLVILSGSCKPGDSWTVFSYPEGKFKIEFPNAPATEKRVINSVAGELTMNIILYDASKEKNNNLIYMVNYTDYPDSLVNSDQKERLKDFFRNSIDGAVNNVHGKLLSESVVASGNFPGREIRIDFNNGTAVITARIFLVKNRMYMIEVITETKNDFNKSINHFLDSFSLL